MLPTGRKGVLKACAVCPGIFAGIFARICLRYNDPFLKLPMSDYVESTRNWQPSAPPIPRKSTVRRLLRRTIFGVLFALPILLTVFVVYQIFLILSNWVISPVASLIAPFIVPMGIEDPYWTAVERYVLPGISLMSVLLIFYILGYAFQSRLSRWVDWGFGYIPGISMLYRAIRDASQAMQGPDGLKKIDTVVLVPFPHPGARATGFLMGECEDSTSGKPLVCVYVPIALFPPSGYTLIFPRDDVIYTRWEASSPWKLLLSGGLTVPGKIPFEKVVKDERLGE